MKNMNAHVKEYANLQRTVPALRFREEKPFAIWQTALREKLETLLGLPLEQCPANTEVEYIRQKNGYRDCRFTVQTEPGFYVPCHLLIPDGNRASYPLTVCLSGHCNGMHIALGEAKSPEDQQLLEEWPHRAIGLRAVKEGRCGLVIEARNFGESSVNGYGMSCTEAAKIAILMGRTVIGCRVWDAMRALDAVAETFPEVDMSDIVCTGNSGGGTATYYLACMDIRITAAAPSCSICDYEDSIAAMPHCLCNHIPYSRKYFEMSDLAGLIAPRRLVIAAGKEDPIFPIAGTLRTFQEIRRIYTAAGVPENCSLVIGEAGHLNYADLLWGALNKLPKEK